MNLIFYYILHIKKFIEEYQKKVSAQKNNGDKTSGSQIVKANGGR